MSKHTVPLTEFADWHGQVKGVEIRSYMPFEPYVPTDDIAVDVGRVATAAKFGHLKSVAFKRHSETDSVAPGINGVSEDGSATASFMSTAKKAPRIDSEVNRDSISIFSKGTSAVKINFGHSDLDDINLHSAKEWASYLDTSISQGLCLSAVKRIGKNGVRRSLIGALLLAGPTSALLHGDFASAGQEYVTNVAFYSCVTGFIDGPDAELTLAPGFSLDRIGLVQAYTKNKRLVEATS